MSLNEKWNELNKLERIIHFWMENCLSNFHLTLSMFADHITLVRRYFLVCFVTNQLNIPCETEMKNACEMVDKIRSKMSLILVF